MGADIPKVPFSDVAFRVAFGCSDLTTPCTFHDGRMNHKLLSGLTVALLIATQGALPGYADQSGSLDESQAVKVSAESASSNQEASTSAHGAESQAPVAQVPVAQTPVAQAPVAQVHGVEANVASSRPPASPPTSQLQSGEAVKVGEYQSQDLAHLEKAIAIIHPHQMAGRQAATLYVRNIPVLTFLAPNAPNSSVSAPFRDNNPANERALKASEQTPSERQTQRQAVVPNSEVKVASTQNSSLDHSSTTLPLAPGAIPGNASSSTTNANNPSDPVWRATEISARLNQFHQNSLDASTINVGWDTQQQQYVIKVGDDVLVAMDANTILPNTTENPTEDALQATNLIRRQMGNAPPIDRIPGSPDVGAILSLGVVQFKISGMASWYGPGFDGSYSASGEVFNENDLTAAHRDLPFGTQVRVTNMDNGMSVVVRINDRGPYADDRVIDLSRGAASVIGLVQSGVAPVSLEVLGAARAASR